MRTTVATRFATIALVASAILAMPALAETPNIMVVTSDPQYPWTPDLDNGEDDPAVDLALAESLIREQYESINAFRRSYPGQSIPVIVNGDITSHGFFWEHQKINELFGILGEHVYYGLGNHDYQNNLANNVPCQILHCAMDSLDNLTPHVLAHRRKNRVLDYDLSNYVEGGTLHKEGSRAYSFRPDGWERVVNVQLNNSPTYTATIDWKLGSSSRYEVTSSVPWLARNLPVYDDPQTTDFIVLHAHKPSHWTHGPSPELISLIKTHRVAAVFSGHFHKDMGRAYASSWWGGVPVFISGSASQRTWLIVEHWPESQKLKVYGVRENDPAQRELIGDIDV